jgi:hypothetical protein
VRNPKVHKRRNDMAAATAGIDVRERRIDHCVTASLDAGERRVDDLAPVIMSVVRIPVAAMSPPILPRIVLDFDRS